MNLNAFQQSVQEQFLTDCLVQSHKFGLIICFFGILYYGEYRCRMDVTEMVSTILLLSFFQYNCVFMRSYAIQNIITIRVSFDRIANILNIHNCEMPIQDQQNNQFNQQVLRIQLKNFYSQWSSRVTTETRPVLKDLTIEINQGESWLLLEEWDVVSQHCQGPFCLKLLLIKVHIKLMGKKI